jgi:hypothetical protein
MRTSGLRQRKKEKSFHLPYGADPVSRQAITTFRKRAGMCDRQHVVSRGTLRLEPLPVTFSAKFTRTPTRS